MKKNLINSLSTKWNILSQLFCRLLRCGTASRGRHSGWNFSSSASIQNLNMECFLALVLSCSVVLSMCSVSSASDQPDIVKRKETCQERNGIVSEQSETRSWFNRLSPSHLKHNLKRLELLLVLLDGMLDQRLFFLSPLDILSGFVL